MLVDIQKASMWKRISAYIFDMILLGILAVGLATVLSFALGYDKYAADLDEAYAKYEREYGVEFGITEDEYDAMSEEDRAVFDEASFAVSADKDAIYSYNMIVNLTLIITTFSILLSYLALEFVLPLVFKNGQTLGKKIFGIALMRNDGVKINTVSLFIRTVLGKFTVETMIPVLILIMIFLGSMGVVGVIVIGLIGLLQIILLIATKTNSAIHDVLANTVAVDFASQRIFDSMEEQIEYKKQLHAEEVAKREYF
ncbi:MAG: RDD family protein [Ruminococcaceae bacterium]|nr:RDD family protein [Oscillospiraceae bacterium]